MDTVKELKAEYDEQHILELAYEQAKLEDEYRRYATECMCGMRTVLARLQNLQDMIVLAGDYNPIADIDSRVKDFVRVAEKCERKGYPLTIDTIKKKIGDVAGIRIVVYFREDIYRVADMLARQPSLTIVNRCDYVANPKESGYRSLHLDTLMTIYLEDSSRAIPIEIQIRSKSQDGWASVEHILGYTNPDNSPEDKKTFQEMSALLDEFDSKLEVIYERMRKKRTGVTAEVTSKEKAPAPKKRKTTKNPAK